MTKVIVHIDRLRVPGPYGARADALVDALRTQLGRDLANAELVGGIVRGGDVDRVRVSEVRLAPSSTTDATGRSVAHAIAGRLAHAGNRPRGVKR